MDTSDYDQLIPFKNLSVFSSQELVYDHIGRQKLDEKGCYKTNQNGQSNVFPLNNFSKNRVGLYKIYTQSTYKYDDSQHCF